MLRVRNLGTGLLLVTAACLLLVIFIFSLTALRREFDSLAKIELRGLVLRNLRL